MAMKKKIKEAEGYDTNEDGEDFFSAEGDLLAMTPQAEV
jgi:hypothetical protein